MNLDDLLDLSIADPDLVLGSIVGGIARAEARHKAKLRTVDADGNLIQDVATTDTKDAA